MREIELDGNSLSLEQAMSIARGSAIAILSDESRQRMLDSRMAVENLIESGETVYGINTGFGAMSSVMIDDDELELLQENLVRSHACGVGEKMEPEHAILMMVFRANSLAKGVSGSRPELVELILSMIFAPSGTSVVTLFLVDLLLPRPPSRPGTVLKISMPR